LTPEIEAIVNELDAAVPNDGILLLRANASERTLTTVLIRGEAEDEIRRAESFPYSGLTGRAVERGTPLLVNDAHLDPRAVVYSDPVHPEAIVLFPLVREGEVVGCVNVYRDGSGRRFEDDDLERVRPFAERLAAVL
jgi:GAF domain-containing protein